MICLDFETHYDQNYTLKKMSTWEYIRDPRFKVLGWGASSLRGLSTGEWWTEPTYQEGPPVPVGGWPLATVVGFNLAFDASILTHLGFPPAARYIDVMLMARYAITQGILDPEQGLSLASLAHVVGGEKMDMATSDLGEYCKNDVALTVKLYEYLKPHVPESEMDYIDLHVRCWSQPGFDLDRERAQVFVESDKRIAKLFPLIRQEDVFANMLTKRGVLLRYKTTVKGTWKLATAQGDGWLAELRGHPDPMVSLLAEAKQRAHSTITRTRAQTFLDVGAPVPAPIWYYAAHPGRSGGADGLNVQNLPRGQEGLRSILKAPPGHVIMTVDSSQIQVRVNMQVAEAEHALEAFRRKEDPYMKFAREYLYPGREITKESLERQVAKSAYLALGFGQGAAGFIAYCARQKPPITVPQEEADRVVRVFRDSLPGLTGRQRGAWFRLVEEVARTGTLTLPSGRKLIYNGIGHDENGEWCWYRQKIFRKSPNREMGKEKLWHGKITENYVMACERDIIFPQLVEMQRRGWRLLTTTHDSGTYLVREDDVEKAKQDAEECFTIGPKWAGWERFPLACEIKISERFQ